MVTFLVSIILFFRNNGCLFAFSAYFAAISIKESTFTLTGPATYTISRTTDTVLTFDAGLINADATDVSLTSVKLYLSDNIDLAAGGATLSAPIDITGFPTTVPGNADGTSTGLATGMTATVKLASATDCSTYTTFCIQVEPSQAFQCIGISGNTNCEGECARKDR